MKRRILEQYWGLHTPLKATIWFTMCQLLQKGLSILTTPLFTRVLPTEEYGRISVFFSWESIVLILITLSSGKANMNLCVKHEDKRKLFSAFTGLNITLSILFGAVICLFYQPIIRFTGLSRMMIISLYFYCLSQNIILCWSWFNQYYYLYKIVVLETLIYSSVASLGGLATVVFVSQTAEARIIPQVMVSVCIGLTIIIGTFRKSKVFYDHEIWKYTLSFCVPLLPHYFSEIILLNSDRIMIDKMCGSSDVAIYSIAYSVGSLITMVTSAINSAFGPYQYHKIKAREFGVLAKNTNYIIGFIAVCLCGIMLFGREIVLLFGGQKYVQSISLIIPISLGVFFNYVFQLFARVQEYFEQKYTILIASVSCALLNIVLNYIFINIYNYKAAAYTTFLCYFMFCFLHYLFYRMACRKHIGHEIYDIKGLALISMCLFAASMVISLISDLYILKYILIVVTLTLMIWQRKRIMKSINTIREASNVREIK